MAKRSLLLFICLFCPACSVITIDFPMRPEIPSPAVSFPETLFSVPGIPFMYSAKEGAPAEKRLDDVTIRVLSLDSLAPFESICSQVTVAITGPDGLSCRCGLFPAIVSFEVENGTGHTLVLGKSDLPVIVRLEDDKGHPYPPVNSQEEAKRGLADCVKKAFEDSRQNLAGAKTERKALVHHLAPYRKAVFEEYALKYDAARSRAASALSSPFCSGIRTKDMPEDYVLTEKGLNEILRSNSPEVVFYEGASQIESMLRQGYRSLLQEKLLELERLQEDAVAKILSFPVIPNLATALDCPAIVILPGRKERIIVPFLAKSPDQDTGKLFLGIYGLPTQMDAAGLPVKRSNCVFELEAGRVYLTPGK